MAHAEICPVCKGTGEVDINESFEYKKQSIKTCHGCRGTGWVTIQDDSYTIQPPYKSGKTA